MRHYRIYIYKMINLKIKNDFVGAFTGLTCMIHCMATPFIFVTKVCATTGCLETPFWWQVIDYFFILISFVVIWRVTKNSNNNILRIAFWFSWIILFLSILNEKLEMFPLSEAFIYLPSLTIITRI